MKPDSSFDKLGSADFAGDGKADSAVVIGVTPGPLDVGDGFCGIEATDASGFGGLVIAATKD